MSTERQQELARLLADFRLVAKLEYGYEEDGAWWNNRMKGLAFKSGYSYDELWIQMYRIGGSARGPVEQPVHFHGTFTVADMLEATIRKVERERVGADE